MLIIGSLISSSASLGMGSFWWKRRRLVHPILKGSFAFPTFSPPLLAIANTITKEPSKLGKNHRILPPIFSKQASICTNTRRWVFRAWPICNVIDAISLSLAHMLRNHQDHPEFYLKYFDTENFILGINPFCYIPLEKYNEKRPKFFCEIGLVEINSSGNFSGNF